MRQKWALCALFGLPFAISFGCTDSSSSAAAGTSGERGGGGGDSMGQGGEARDGSPGFPDTGSSDTGAVGDALTGDFVIAYPVPHPPIDFAIGNLDAVVVKLGGKPVHKTDGVDGARVVVQIAAPGSAAGVQKEGFQINRDASGNISVTAVDERGAMYGVLELAEQASMRSSIDAVPGGLHNPRIALRAVKWNMPWTPYRRHNALFQHKDAARDLAYWQRFLDTMALNRLNTLTLWGLHPWPLMAVSPTYPNASPAEPEMTQWKQFWTSLFKMAHERAIDTYVLNWNVEVSAPFKANYNANSYSDVDDFTGNAAPGNTGADVATYTSEVVYQTIKDYPNLDGIGISLGDRMADITSPQRMAWVRANIYSAVERAVADTGHNIGFIQRAAFDLGGDPEVRSAIEGLKTTGPKWVELKFNTSHPYNTTQLLFVHSGGKGEAYYIPAPSAYKVAWMMRNEDFHILRWGEPGFIRDHIAANGKDYVGGYFIGSETYIPVLDYFTKPGHPAVDWKYAFERQWLYYEEWGRLLYEPTTSDDVFRAGFDRRYGAGVGAKLFDAYQFASRVVLNVNIALSSTWDMTLYVEAMSQPQEGAAGFVTADKLRTILPPSGMPFYQVQRFVADETAGALNPSLTTPLQLADRIDKDCDAAAPLLATISTASSASLDNEVDDAYAWVYLGRHFAAKLRAAVALERYLTTGNPANRKTEAVQAIDAAVTHWQALVTATSKHYGVIPTVQLAGNPIVDLAAGNFSWADYLPVVQKEASDMRAR